MRRGFLNLNLKIRSTFLHGLIRSFLPLNLNFILNDEGMEIFGRLMLLSVKLREEVGCFAKSVEMTVGEKKKVELWMIHLVLL